MKALPLSGRSLPTPVYGVVVIVVVVVCLIILVRHGSDPASATASLVTLMVAGADVTHRLVRSQGLGEKPGPSSTPGT